MLGGGGTSRLDRVINPLVDSLPDQSKRRALKNVYERDLKKREKQLEITRLDGMILRIQQLGSILVYRKKLLERYLSLRKSQNG